MSVILIVDDEPTICWGLERIARDLGHEPLVANSAEQALKLAAQHLIDAVVLDVRLPGMSGLEVLEQLRAATSAAPIVVMTAYGTLPTAVEAVQKNAFEFIVKPFDIQVMKSAIARALEHTLAPEEPPGVGHRVGEMVGHSAAMRDVFRRIALASSSEASVLLSGESGVGKELAARAIHRYSPRADGPFVAVNVASLSASLAESELFGHAQGAFTGADAARQGLLVQASGGTLFLDEVADIPLPLQVKLLRALEQREVVPVGGNLAVPADFRIVSATHRDLNELVARGEFRHDLYFRLAGFEIPLPPLREREGDVVLLAEHFLKQLASRSGRNLYFTGETQEELCRRPWQGNVRELYHAVEHAVVVARQGAIHPQHLPEQFHTPRRDSLDPQSELVSATRAWVEQRLADDPPCESLQAELMQIVEPPLLEASLSKHRGQYLPAARLLGMHRTTLRKKLEQYGLVEE